ncbi:MAG: (d)CMP kinase [Coriobacteriaceae bacterium]|nr:(d)CMP kinase [Coriobacteriaceae bacterium]MDD6768968.1 (d)CMP kinase [Coriobacteriaceae bacterium]
MIIAIDGPAGSGKSTVAKEVAKMLGFHYLDTGAMYRSIAWLALERGISLDDDEAVADLARTETVVFSHEEGNPLPSGVAIAGHDITLEIRTPRIDKAVSPVSAIPAVREALTQQQRAIAASENIVMEGRDIGTVVFPRAELKVFLTASAEERARRRALQNAQRGFGETDEAAILADIIRRDEADSTRAVAPLRPAEDAVMLDTTGMGIDEVCAAIANLARRR